MLQEEQTIIEKAISDPISAIRKLTLNNLYYFIQYFWSCYSQQPFVPNWHIEYICKELEIIARKVANNETKLYDLIINVPPGTTKTATVSIFFPIWCWCNWYWMRFITASYTQPLSLESAEYSREVIRSDKFREMYPEIDIKEDKDTKSNFRVIKNHWEHLGYVPRIEIGGSRFSTSVGGSVTGFHGHINIADDPIDPNSALSEADITSVNYWMDNVLSMRKVDKRVTVTILVMQRLAQEDPTGHWLKIKGAKVRHICLPGEIKNFLKNVKPPELAAKYINGLLDVNRLGWPELQEINERGQYVYSGQVGQDPVPLGGGMFKTDKLIILTRMPDPGDVAMSIISTVRYWDKAATPGGLGARTAGVKMSKLKNGKYIIENVKKGRWATEERESIIESHARADGNRCKVGIEQEPGSGGKESAQATIKNLAGFVTTADRPQGNKVFRADPFSVQVNNSNVYLMVGDWNEEYIDEMKNFPNSTLKDQIDASSGAFAMLTKLKQAGVVVR